MDACLDGHHRMVDDWSVFALTLVPSNAFAALAPRRDEEMS
jgi:hypothetical protein